MVWTRNRKQEFWLFIRIMEALLQTIGRDDATIQTRKEFLGILILAKFRRNAIGRDTEPPDIILYADPSLQSSLSIHLLHFYSAALRDAKMTPSQKVRLGSFFPTESFRRNSIEISPDL
jgi:hypothetical protein